MTILKCVTRLLYDIILIKKNFLTEIKYVQNTECLQAFRIEN